MPAAGARDLSKPPSLAPSCWRPCSGSPCWTAESGRKVTGGRGDAVRGAALDAWAGGVVLGFLAGLHAGGKIWVVREVEGHHFLYTRTMSLEPWMGRTIPRFRVPEAAGCDDCASRMSWMLYNEYSEMATDFERAEECYGRRGRRGKRG